MKKTIAFLTLPLAVATLFTAPLLRAADEVKAPAPKATEPAAPAKPAAKPYKLDTCLVSGEKLDSMGKPYVFEHEGQEIKMCCKGCLKDFNKEPAKFLKELEEKTKAKG